MAPPAASERRFGLPFSATSAPSSAASTAQPAISFGNLGRAGERVRDGRLADDRLERLRQAERGEHLLVGRAVGRCERCDAGDERIGLERRVGGAVPVVDRQAGGHRGEAAPIATTSAATEPAPGRGLLRGDLGEQVVQGLREEGLDRGQNSPIVFPVSSMSTLNAAGETP